MKALVKTEPKRGIELQEIPVPTPGSNEVLVRVKACGICGSDVTRYLWTKENQANGKKDMSQYLPRVMGHEFSGQVEVVGNEVKSHSVGDHVVIQNVMGCGSCEYCDAGLPNLCPGRRTIGVNIDGGFAEFVSLPVNNVYHVPEGVPLETVAFMQPFAIGTYAMEIGRVQPGTRVGVWGVGAIGLSIIMNAQLAGAQVVFAVGRGGARLDVAKALGVEHTVSVNEVSAEENLRESIESGSIDVVFEASASPQALGISIPILRRAGRLVLLGNLKEPVSLDLLPAIMDQKDILSVRTYSLKAWRRALTLIGRVPIGKHLGPSVPLSEGVHAFERAANGEGVKFLIKP